MLPFTNGVFGGLPRPFRAEVCLCRTQGVALGWLVSHLWCGGMDWMDWMDWMD